MSDESEVYLSVGRLTTTNNVYTGGMTKINVPAIRNLALHIPISTAEEPSLHSFDVGDLVICKKDARVGQVVRRDLILDFERNSKTISNIRIVGTYEVDFSPSRAQTSNTQPQWSTLISLTYQHLPTFKEYELELAFNK